MKPSVLKSFYRIPVGSNNNILRYQHGSQVTTAQYDKQDRLLSLKGAIERDFTYSEDGELTKISNCLGEKKFEYDFFGNLKKVILPDGKVIQYKLDAFNRRVARSVNGQIKNYYLWQDQTHLWAILKPNGTIDTQYVYGLYSQAPIYFLKGGAKYIVLPNERGDIRYVLDFLGRVVQNIEYDEYGMVLNDTSITAQNTEGLQPLRFASGLYDQDTKLVLFNARSYDPIVGRWTSKDPIGFAGGSTNFYGYAASDPVNWIDPSGLSSIIFDNVTGTITVKDKDGAIIGTFPASNNASSKSGGPFPVGTFQFEKYNPHTGASADSAYGSNGNFMFVVPGRSDMGIHSGRANTCDLANRCGSNHATMGCVRTNDSATIAIKNLHFGGDPLTHIEIK